MSEHVVRAEPLAANQTFTHQTLRPTLWDSATQRQSQPVTHLRQTIPMISLSSAADIPVSSHRLDPCPNICKVSLYMCGLKKADWLGELKGSCQGGPVCGPPLNEVSSERKRDTERKEGERKSGGTDGSKTQPNWLPTGRGREEGGREELAHPNSPLPDQLPLQD